MVLCDTVATKSHNHSSVIASYTAYVEHSYRVGAGSTGTAILSLAGTVVLYHACNWYPHRGPPLFEVQGDVSIGSVHAKVIKISLLYSLI